MRSPQGLDWEERTQDDGIETNKGRARLQRVGHFTEENEVRSKVGKARGGYNLVRLGRGSALGRRDRYQNWGDRVTRA